ncbi:DUF3299 domain-containing protein [Meridianimarinicoccus aquatilis]|uniref:DUF3299 domain-containing protein n=1 Tax=Meridianimarinicoccus aquatilis TaxID=2552766 RepID=UPI001FB6FAD7|nr:DUF3299 domain-containing protein [Fluviibacterium aquatile]
MGGLVTSTLVPTLGFAEEVIDLDWEDLLPQDNSSVPEILRGIVQHDNAPLSSQQPTSAQVRTDWNGKVVRIPGYIVPIDYRGTGVVAFILVPYVGACVHVPPPPANQLVLVTTDKPYESVGLFEAVQVTGVFGAASTSTQLADIGYALSADTVEPFKG